VSALSALGAVSVLLLLPAPVHAAEVGCIPTPAAASELTAVLAYSLLAYMPPVKDKVDPNGYENGNGDNDGDGVRNKSDAFPNDAQETVDTDGDGVGDNSDAFPKDPKESRDADCDGIGDNADPEYTGLGRVATVDHWSGDGVYGQQARFTTITTPEGVQHLRLKLKLTGARDQKREASWEHEIEKFWSNDGFSLDIQWVDSGQDNVIHVSRGSGRANSGNLFTETDKWVASHEIGHLLGLNDEYGDSNDPHRLIGEANSIMRANWDGAVPYNRHLKAIMAQFDCDRSRPATADDIAALKDHEATPVPEAEDRPQVTPPAGTSKYTASGDAYKDAFVKKDGENVYLAHTRGDWWEWTGTLDSETLSFVHPNTGETLVVEAGRLSKVVETLPETTQPAAVVPVPEPASDPDPVVEPDPQGDPGEVTDPEPEPTSEVPETETSRPVPPRFRGRFRRLGWR
jgi:hypothetical protein